MQQSQSTNLESSGLTARDLSNLSKIDQATIEAYTQNFADYLKPSLEKRGKVYPTSSLKTVLKIKSWFDEGLSRQEVMILLQAGQLQTSQTIVQEGLLKRKLPKSNAYITKVPLEKYKDFVDGWEARKKELEEHINAMEKALLREVRDMKSEMNILEHRHPHLVEKILALGGRIEDIQSDLSDVRQNVENTCYTMGVKSEQLEDLHHQLRKLKETVDRLEEEKRNRGILNFFKKFKLFNRK